MITKAERFQADGAKQSLPSLDDLYRGKIKQMSKEEIEKSVSRLAAVKEKESTLPPLIPKSHISEEAISKLAVRLCDESLKQKQKKIEELRKQANALSNDNQKLSKRQQRAVADRLCHPAERTKLKEEYYKTQYKLPETRVVKSTTLHENLDRMYEESMQRKAATQKKLHEKYIAATELKPKRLPPVQLDELASRLAVPPTRSTKAAE